VEDLQIVHGADGAGATVTVSIGGSAAMPARGRVATDLLAAADEALYLAKGSGKNRAVVQDLPAPAKNETHA
jgi:two-component system chemotaxis family response regulator WspR